jgi:hypothetical protein
LTQTATPYGAAKTILEEREMAKGNKNHCGFCCSMVHKTEDLSKENTNCIRFVWYCEKKRKEFGDILRLIDECTGNNPDFSDFICEAFCQKEDETIDPQDAFRKFIQTEARRRQAGISG